MNADHGRTLVQERLDLREQLLRELFQLRTETCLHALSGPDQLFAERRQRRPLAAAGFDQRRPEERRPLLDQVPDMTVGKLGVGRGAGEFAGVSDLVENAEHHHDRLRAALLPESPDGLDLDLQHRAYPLMNSTSYI